MSAAFIVELEVELEVEVTSGSLCLSSGLFAILAVKDSDEITPSNCCLNRRPLQEQRNKQKEVEIKLDERYTETGGGNKVR